MGPTELKTSIHHIPVLCYAFPEPIFFAFYTVYKYSKLRTVTPLKQWKSEILSNGTLSTNLPSISWFLRAQTVYKLPSKVQSPSYCWKRNFHITKMWRRFWRGKSVSRHKTHQIFKNGGRPTKEIHKKTEEKEGNREKYNGYGHGEANKAWERNTRQQNCERENQNTYHLPPWPKQNEQRKSHTTKPICLFLSSEKSSYLKKTEENRGREAESWVKQREEIVFLSKDSKLQWVLSLDHFSLFIAFMLKLPHFLNKDYFINYQL